MLNNNTLKISPSVMCADFSNLGRDIAKLEKGGADWLHFDVMDGSFVPNFAMGPDIIRSARKLTKIPFDVHMMVKDPGRYVEMFVKSGADIISVHAEAGGDVLPVLAKIREFGAKSALAISPETEVKDVEYALGSIDMALVMTVKPGFAGQAFIEPMIDKVGELKKALLGKSLPQVEIEVDGAISETNIPKLAAAGANVFVGGTASIFRKGEDIETNTRKIKHFLAAL